MVKTTAVMKKIRKAARELGLEVETFEGANHTRIRVGSVKTTIGRHSETSNIMAETIYKQLEPELGEDWWR